MAKTFFPDNMTSGTEMSLEGIAAKLTYFQEQLHLIHWRTDNHAEHLATGALYDYIQDFKDEVIEKLMGYTDKTIKAFRMEPLSELTSANAVAVEIISFANELKVWAAGYKYDDIENLAQSLSGEAAKTKFLLKLS